MPLQATSGAASYDAFGGGVAAVPNYIEECFSAFLYTGNGSTQTITNGIDESGKGAMTWIKCRSDATSHALYDTERGAGRILTTNTTGAQTTSGSGRGLSSFNSTGFSLDDDSFSGRTNQSGSTYASWTFRKQPKFFDVVTWSGTGMSVAHSLGTTPATIILKRTNAVDDWYVVHRSANGFFSLNTTNAASGTSNAGIGTDTNTAWVAATSTTCNFENFGNAAGTYVAYLFAHNAGGFGLTGTDNVISCGSYTGNGSTSGPTVTLGYEPQWILVKNASGANPWNMDDNMRGWEAGGLVQNLQANASYAEGQQGPALALNSTGFKVVSNDSDWNGTSATYIYIAIRRGPMKVPTSGTSVFAPAYYASGLATGTKSVTNFPVDMQIARYPDFGSTNSWVADRLRGVSSNATASGPYLMTFSTNAETTNSSLGWDNTGFLRSPNLGTFDPQVYWNFRRAPNTHDEVCYTGTGSNITLNHNLGAIPELMIFKTRTGAARAWGVYSSAFGVNKKLLLNTTAAVANDSFFVDTTPTSTVFYPGNADESNEGGNTYVAYLFATCAGVSKVGTFTGNGSTQAIACGFTGGSRFVLIKATSTTGNWICVDTARGMTTSSNPVLYLNSNAAETATSGACITSTGGFTVDESKLTGVNTSGVSYIFLSYA